MDRDNCCQKAYYENGALNPPSFPNYVLLDRRIQEQENTLVNLKQSVEQCATYLKKLKEVRKQVTPEMEASLHALKDVGLI